MLLETSHLHNPARNFGAAFSAKQRKASLDALNKWPRSGPVEKVCAILSSDSISINYELFIELCTVQESNLQPSD